MTLAFEVMVPMAACRARCWSQADTAACEWSGRRSAAQRYSSQTRWHRRLRSLVQFDSLSPSGQALAPWRSSVRRWEPEEVEPGGEGEVLVAKSRRHDRGETGTADALSASALATNPVNNRRTAIAIVAPAAASGGPPLLPCLIFVFIRCRVNGRRSRLGELDTVHARSWPRQPAPH